MSHDFRNRLDQLAAQLTSSLGDALLAKFPLATYLGFIRAPHPGETYARFPGPLAPWLDRLAESEGAGAMRDVHRLALVSLMQTSLEREPDLPVPETMRHELRAWWRALADRIEARDDAHLDTRDDYLAKDVAIASLDLIPTTGPCHFEDGGIPLREFVFKGGPLQALRSAWALSMDLRGQYRRMLTIHLEDRKSRETFNVEGWTRMYLDAADVLRLRPDLSGWQAGAWFFDPALAQVSPHMKYLADLPRDGGAWLFDMGPRPDAVTYSLRRSEHRRRLYEEGRYRPVNCMVVWPRRDLLNWAARQRSRTAVDAPSR